MASDEEDVLEGEQLSRLIEQAREEGRVQGHKQGYNEGWQAALTALMEAIPVAIGKLASEGLATVSLDELIRHPMFTVRQYNLLRKSGYTTIGSVVASSEAELLSITGMGEKTVNEIKILLGKLGYSLAG